jgi:hypothetical protein
MSAENPRQEKKISISSQLANRKPNDRMGAKMENGVRKEGSDHLRKQSEFQGVIIRIPVRPNDVRRTYLNVSKTWRKRVGSLLSMAQSARLKKLPRHHMRDADAEIVSLKLPGSESRFRCLLSLAVTA